MSISPARVLVCAFSVAAFALPVQAQTSATKLAWAPAPAVFPAGAKMAVVSGDPGKAAPFVVQLAFPSGYVIPPHWHPTEENLVVKSGTFWVGMGDKVDAKAMNPMKAGEKASVPPKMNHYAKADGATVVEVSAMGPFAMTYVSKADEPAAMKKGK